MGAFVSWWCSGVSFSHSHRSQKEGYRRFVSRASGVERIQHRRIPFPYESVESELLGTKTTKVPPRITHTAISNLISLSLFTSLV
jgi:hypothetical protein